MLAYIHSLFDAIIVKLLALGAFVGLCTGLFAGVIQKRHGSIGAWARGVAIAVFVGGLSALTLSSVEWPAPVEVVIIAIAAYAGEDVLAGLAALSKAFGNDPVAAVLRVFDAWRGGPRL